MRRFSLLVILCGLWFTSAHAQTTQFANPCYSSPVQQTIRFCTPLSGVSTQTEFLVRARINDVDTVRWTLKIDESLINSVSGTGRDVIVQLGYLGTPFDGWHKLTITATNATKSYSSSVWVKTNNEEICPVPANLNSVNICHPQGAEGVTNPVHIAASANYADPKAMVIYVDGVKAARNSTENSGNGWTISQYLLLTPGTHKVTVQARTAAAAVASKTVTFVVLK